MFSLYTRFSYSEISQHLVSEAMGMEKRHSHLCIFLFGMHETIQGCFRSCKQKIEESTSVQSRNV